ncbi:MAG TPA: flavin reductase family protein [Candidatus Fermentibacter daniensis]|nr:MAG: flavin reductase [Candidatus Fermentibacter daniensis]OQC69607.1 MAG: Flavoredoxin [candidate division Hyd24-12 bacterium ADurb.Bin004]KZD16481.1 MAG: flavin reductase [Candidatus Fermentibacter daniensis]KZD19852.1 MAG: flavin reductase [Candidatus Fermentibacter daniensis]NLI02515.1 flavin reductase family protein [Candidatus Fermentibacter daniensis]
MGWIRIDRNVFPCPMPVVLVGVEAGGRANFMTVAWVSRVNSRPPMIAVAIGRGHFTNGGIRTSRAFSVGVPPVGLMDRVDHCGIVSGADTDKSRLFTVVYGEETGAPMAGECPVSMECRLVQTVEFPTDDLFIGEIVGAYADPDCCPEGGPDITRIRPFTLTMPDNRYWETGQYAGRAWNARRVNGLLQR